MATKSMEVFPDLHHKMSKKIAQLTKVIYHLNTKNEDHQAEVDNLAANNQMEIQHILRDAASKINKFKELVETKQSSTNIEAALTKLQNKHDLEKQCAIRDLERFKNQSKEREETIASEYQNKFELTQEKVEKMNTKFRERIEAFEKLSEQYKIDIANAKSAGNSDAEALKLKYEQEMEAYVIKNNEKYQNMLVEQLGIQEQIKNEYETKIVAVTMKMETQFDADLKKQLGMQRAKLNGEKEELLLQLKREHEIKLSKLKEEESLKLEKALAELKKRSEEMNSLREEKDMVIKELNEKLIQLNTTLTNALSSTDSKCQELLDNITRTEKEVLELKELVDSKNVEIDRLNKMLTEAQEQYFDLSSQMNSLEAEILRLNELLSSKNHSMDDLENQLKTQLNTAKLECNQFKKRFDDASKEILTLKNDLKKQLDEHKIAISKLESIIKQLKTDNSNLNNNLKEKSTLSGQEVDKMKIEIEDLKKQLLDKDRFFKNEKIELESNHKKIIENLHDKHRTEVMISDGKLKELNDTMNQLEVSHQQSVMEMKKEQISIIQENDTDWNEKMNILKKEHEDAILKLKNSIATLESQITSLSSQADSDKGAMKGEMSKLDNKVKSLLNDIEKRKKESEKNESVQTSLKNQIESLREELKQVQLSNKEKLAIQKTKIDNEWQLKLDALGSAHSKGIQDSLDQLGMQHKKQIDDLSADYESQLLALKQALQQEASSAQEMNLIIENERMKLENMLAEEKKAHIQHMNEWEIKYNTDMKDMELRLKKNNDDLLKENQNKASILLKETITKYELEKTEYTNAMTEMQLNMRKELTTEYTDKMSSLEMDCKNQLIANQKKFDEDLVKQLAIQQQKHDGIIQDLNGQHTTNEAAWNSDREVIQNMLSASQKDNIHLHNEIVALEEKMKTHIYNFDLEKQQLQNEFDVIIQKQQTTHDSEQLTFKQEMDREIQSLKNDFKEDCIKFEERMKEAKAEYEKLLVRYKNRESRVEDLQRIEDLERQMIDKDALVKQTRDEMNYFKREMLNREEGYNQKFNSTPNVGVMNPLDNKKKKPEKGKKGFGGTNNKPNNFVQSGSAGGSSSSVGGGLGMGIGGGIAGGGGSVRTQSK